MPRTVDEGGIKHREVTEGVLRDSSYKRTIEGIFRFLHHCICQGTHLCRSR